MVLDECFSPDTPIDAFNIYNSLELKYIKDIAIGDKIYNAGGIDHVRNICKRPIDRAIQICIEGRRFTCSENHPWFTLYGWRFAKDLQSGDCLMATEEAVRLVRKDFSTEIRSEQDGEILRDILLSEMENEHSGTQSESSYSGDSSQKGQEKIRMVQEGRPESLERIKSNSKFKPNVKSKNSSKNDSSKNCKRNIETMEREKGRKWQSLPNSTTDNDRLFTGKLVSGICNFFREAASWISNLLQSRRGESNSKNSNRNRWDGPYKQEKANHRQKERQKTSFFRVESIEILEQGHPELEKYRDESGIVYFYDIEAERHPSFSVNKCLVHNSSILKNFTGIRRNEIIDAFKTTKYKLACTATPSPNDFSELGNHSEFLGVMPRSEMLATFFINDTAHTGTWRLKGHVKDNMFWKWVASWAVMITKPSDIGFDNNGFILPEIKYHQHIIETKKKSSFGFFPEIAQTLNDRRKVRNETIEIRCNEAAEIINSSDDKWAIWCNLNAESELLSKIIKDSKEVAGRHTDEIKANRMIGFANGNLKRIITKPKIAGLGMNWQICNKAAFIGLSDSWEQFYQAVRRIWRFGQLKEVDIHIFIEEREGAVLKNIQRKDKQATAMIKAVVEYMKEITKIELGRLERNTIEYKPNIEMELPEWI